MGICRQSVPIPPSVRTTDADWNSHGVCGELTPCVRGLGLCYMKCQKQAEISAGSDLTKVVASPTTFFHEEASGWQPYPHFRCRNRMHFSCTPFWLSILQILNKDIAGSYFYSAAMSWFISVCTHPRNEAALCHSSGGPLQVHFIAILAECFTTLSVFNISSVASFFGIFLTPHHKSHRHPHFMQNICFINVLIKLSICRPLTCS